MQESMTTSGNVSRKDESKAKNMENRPFHHCSSWSVQFIEKLKIRTGIVLILTGCFQSAEKLFRYLSLHTRNNSTTALCRLYLTQVYFKSNNYTQCLKTCEQIERMTSYTVGQLLENVGLSFQLSLWDVDLKISEAALFMKIRCHLKQREFTEALKNTDLAFVRFHRGQLRHLGRLYYWRGKILTKLMLYLKSNVSYQSSSCFIHR